MRNLIVSAALVAAMFSAKAQTIVFIKSCQEEPTMMLFKEVTYNLLVKKAHVIGSKCMKDDVPVFRVPEGNYLFDNLPIEADEVWLYEVKKAGKVTERGRLTKNGFEAVMTPETVVLIAISKPTCNCTAAQR